MSAPLVAVADLCRHYRAPGHWMHKRATVRALEGVSFELAAGRTLAVVGESGSGKSTLARLVAMIESPTQGRIAIDGIDLAGATWRQRRALRPHVQMVFQSPYASLNPRQHVGSLLAEPLAIQGRGDHRARAAAARDMLGRVGLRPEHARRYPHMFSGGQRQRIAIARALMLRPRLLVADEPLSALDVSIQAQVLNLLLDLKDELGLAYLFISHNLDVVRHLADEVLVLYRGRMMEHGTRDAVFGEPRHPYTRSLLAATPRLAMRRQAFALRVDGASTGAGAGNAGEARFGTGAATVDPHALPVVANGCAFHLRCPIARPRCADERPLPRRVDGVVVACHFADNRG